MLHRIIHNYVLAKKNNVGFFTVNALPGLRGVRYHIQDTENVWSIHLYK